jgi:hypothetical protein
MSEDTKVFEEGDYIASNEQLENLVEKAGKVMQEQVVKCFKDGGRFGYVGEDDPALRINQLADDYRALLSDCRWAMGKVLEANDGDHIITPDSDAQRAQAWLDAHKEQAQ